MEAAGPRGPRVPTARHPPRRAGHRVRAATGRLRQRRAVAGGRAAALLQRPRRLDLRRQQRDSAQHPRQSSIGAVDGLQTQQGTRTAARRARRSSCRPATTSRRVAPRPRPAPAGSPTSGGRSPTSSASSAPPCPKRSAESAAAQSRSWSSPRRSATPSSSSPTSTRSSSPAACCTAQAARAATPLLEQIAEGTAIVALAAAEAESGDRWHDVATTADRDGDGWVLNGAQDHGDDGTARDASPDHRDAPPNGLSLFLVDLDVGRPQASTLHGYRTVDDRRAADLVLDGLRLPGDALLGRGGPGVAVAGAGARRRCSRRLRGSRRRACERCWPTPSNTASSASSSAQPIGSFQVLQHRMVDMHMEVEQAVAAVYLAVLNLDAEPAIRARAVSAAKATIGRAARFVGQNAVQLHGGMGMTEELAIGHYFKRLTAVQYEFGTTDHHIDALCQADATVSSRGWLLFAAMSVIWGIPVPADQGRGRRRLGARTGVRADRDRCRRAASARAVPRGMGAGAAGTGNRCWSSRSSRSSRPGCCSRMPNGTSDELADRPADRRVADHRRRARPLHRRRATTRPASESSASAIGLAGVAVLAGPQLTGGSAWPVIEVLLVATCYAIAPLIAARHLADVPALPMTAACLGVAALVYAGPAAATWPTEMPSTRVSVGAGRPRRHLHGAGVHRLLRADHARSAQRARWCSPTSTRRSHWRPG